MRCEKVFQTLYKTYLSPLEKSFWILDEFIAATLCESGGFVQENFFGINTKNRDDIYYSMFLYKKTVNYWFVSFDQF